jgi:DNA polymerase III delta prime subunit
MNYTEFLKSKQHSSGEFGFKANYIPDIAFDFQRFIIEKAVKKGRTAIFADTGLGKTLIQVSIAKNIINQTNKKVLILTPLAVAFQFILEAEKLGIDDIEYSKDGKHKKKIVICNYERLHHFESSDFECVILDESSILKNFDGKIKNQITSFIKKVPFRFLSTATPSPNDYIELGTSSEALGYLGYTDMLSRFFKNNNNSIDIRHAGCDWYLKPHAEDDFWKWISSWSIPIRKPSDLGFSNEGYSLPKLHEVQTMIINKKPLEINNQRELFNKKASNFLEIKAEVRSTIKERSEKAVELANNHDTSVYWVNLNDEADLIKKLDSQAVEIKGAMNIDKKEEALLAFAKGDIKKLITKTKITAFGLNWQHCNHTTYFPTYSYEQYYQAIRRFWRFGQKREVTVDLVLSDGQSRIMESLQIKKDKANQMFEKLSNNVNETFEIKTKEFSQNIINPKFL